jgi:hypothetical protein
MFAQFRAQYPQGSIKTELLSQKVDGMHVFRVAIADGDLILSTATAADSDLEVAEDRAVKRALILAGISLEPDIREVRLSESRNLRELRESSEPRLKATLLPAETQNELNYPSAQPRQLPRSVPESPPSNNYHNNFEERYSQPTFESIPDARPEDLRENVRSERSEPMPIQPIPPKEPKILEFSDAIAQTNVELMRLGWNEEKGREHLMQTYKKNSRSRLTPEEINQFLAYLQSQASEQPPF